MREEANVHRWDAGYLTQQLKLGFAACRAETNGQIDCFGIDTWGVDFGLLDEGGSLIENPRCYRDATDKEMEASWESVSKRELFERTGIAAMNFKHRLSACAPCARRGFCAESRENTLADAGFARIFSNG